MRTSSCLFPVVMFLFHILPDIAYAQSDEDPTIAWIASYGGEMGGTDYPCAIALDDSGNVCVFGTSDGGEGVTYADYATVEYDASGEQRWVARYHCPSGTIESAADMAVDEAGNVYVTGKSDGGDDTWEDMATIKYSSAGVQQWVARYDSPSHRTDGAMALVIDEAGNVFVTGSSRLSPAYYDYVTVMYNSAGIEQWSARYDGPVSEDDMARDIAMGGDGSVYVTGYSDGSTGDDIATIKYSPSGVQQWVARYDGPFGGGDEGFEIAVDGADNVYVTGTAYRSGSLVDIVTIRYSSAGVQQWVAFYSGPGNALDQPGGMSVDPAGNVYVTGKSGDTSTDMITVEYNASGVQQWAATYDGGGDGDNLGDDIVLDASGNVYVTGFCSVAGNGLDYATIRYDSEGEQQWVAQFNGPGDADDRGIAIALDDAGSVYVTGYAMGGYSRDYTTIRYDQDTGIEGGGGAGAFDLEVSINPTTVVAPITLTLPVSSSCSIRVYGLDGRQVDTVYEGDLTSGETALSWDAGCFPAGVYLVRAVAGSMKATIRVVLLR